MHPLDGIRAALTGLSTSLGLASEEPAGNFDSSLLALAAQLEEGVCREFSLPLARCAVGLRLALQGLLDETSAETFAHALTALDGFVEALQAELSVRADGRAWLLSRQFHDVARHLSSPTSAENPGFHRLPEMLFSSTWVSREVTGALGRAGMRLPEELSGREFRRSQTRRWWNRSRRAPAGALGDALDQMRNDIEFRTRQIWFVLRSSGREPPVPMVYAWAHEDLYGGLQHRVVDRPVQQEVARLASVALDRKLPDFALCLEDAEWVSQYAMNYLIPPSPRNWAVRTAPQLTRILRGRLSRWYFYPFTHGLEPLEMMASVLRVGRPLFYERSVVHAWLEYSLLQGCAIPPQNATLYLDVLAGLEKDFLLHFDGYLLRLMFYPQLRVPEGWCQYLEALTGLHYRATAPPGLDEFRHTFLGQRGLRSPIELLYATAESHGPLN